MYLIRSILSPNQQFLIDGIILIDLINPEFLFILNDIPIISKYDSLSIVSIEICGQTWLHELLFF